MNNQPAKLLEGATHLANDVTKLVAVVEAAKEMYDTASVHPTPHCQCEGCEAWRKLGKALEALGEENP